MKPKVKTKKKPEENYDFMKTNKDNLKNQSFEISEDYNKDTLQIIKTTIYGSF